MYKNLQDYSKIIILSVILISCSTNDGSKHYTTDTTVTISSISHDTSKTKKESNISNNRPQALKESKDLLEVIDSKILFDGNFKPSAYLKLKNNARYSIVGLHINVIPTTPFGKETFDENCVVGIQKKVTILPNKTIVIKEGFEEPDKQSCNYDNGGLVVNVVVYSNGQKLDGMSLLFGDTTLELK